MPRMQKSSNANSSSSASASANSNSRENKLELELEFALELFFSLPNDQNLIRHNLIALMSRLISDGNAELRRLGLFAAGENDSR